MSKKRLTLGMVCSGKPAKLVRKTIGLLINGNTTEYLTLSKNVKADVIKIFLKIVLILQIDFGQPSRNSATKLPSEQGLAFAMKGSNSTDKSFLANSFCEYFRTVARNMKSKSILLRDFTWSKPEKKSC